MTNIFFDENHNVVSVEARPAATIQRPRRRRGGLAGELVVEPPSAKSERTSLDATQRWTVRSRSNKNQYGLAIVTGTTRSAEPFEYAPGFARL